jgi:para-aminobenzoate synthetase component 1
MSQRNLQSWLENERQNGAVALLGAAGFPGGEQTVLASHPSEELSLEAGQVEALSAALSSHRGGSGAWIGFLSYEFGLPFVHEPGFAAPTGAWPAGYLRYYPTFERFGSEQLELPVGRSKPSLGLQAEVSDAVHGARIKALHERLVAGDVYEANLTRRFFAPPVDPLNLFLDLAEHAPAPYAVFFESAFGSLVSNSPEGFLRLTADGEVSTYPIKGTRRRGETAAVDAAMQAELRADEKELAEHLMVVDLMRNDLGRVCAPGTVNCGELFEVVPFPGVWHMVTRVSGRLRPGMSRGELLAATLPAGSITGAPKRAAVQQIHRLEAGPRGPYCGIFLVAPDDGSLAANILIRTAVCGAQKTLLQAGGGIVLDSDPGRECEETWLKLGNFAGEQ